MIKKLNFHIFSMYLTVPKKDQRYGDNAECMNFCKGIVPRPKSKCLITNIGMNVHYYCYKLLLF